MFHKMPQPKPQRPLKQKFFNEFLDKSSIHGLRLLLYYTPIKFARFLWKILILAVVFWAHYIIINLIIHYIGQPTEVRMSTYQVHISQSPFPAVAVCSGYKFSRMKLQAFGERVFEQQQLFRPFYLAQTPQEMAEHLLLLNELYISPFDSSEINQSDIYKLDQILTFMYNTGNYPARDVLRELGPECEKLIVRGIIYGIPVNTTDYFISRLTTTGACCMFNYKRASVALNAAKRSKDNNFMRDNEAITFQANSILNSVQFVLQADVDDYIIREFNIDAFQVNVFPYQDYPRIQSSHVGEVLVNYNSIVEIPIQPEFYESTNRIRQFPPEVRQCYFQDEGQELLNSSYYSIDECLLQCRMASMLKYCGCVSPPMVAIDDNITYCDLFDVLCLRHWNSIWYGWVGYFTYIFRDDINDLTAGNKCPQCRPTCNGVKFRIFVNDMTLRQTYGESYSHGLLEGLNNSKPLAIIKLFYKQRFASSTEMDIVGDWVVLLNRFGGILGLMYGFSIISYIEIVYFATGKFFIFHINQWKRNLSEKISRRQSTAVGNADNKEDLPPAYSLFWDEFQPLRRLQIQQRIGFNGKIL